MADELISRTPEAEVKHQEFLRRCAEHLELLQLVKNKLMEMSMVGEITDYTPYAEQLIEEVKPITDAAWWDFVEDVIMAKDLECEDKVKQERERIIARAEQAIDDIVKVRPYRIVSSDITNNPKWQALKEGA